MSYDGSPGDAPPDAGDPTTRKLVLDLFTEIAILEHLIRHRLEPLTRFGLTPQEFGVINFFCRLGKHEEKLSGLAWSFQVEDSDMRGIVDALVARSLVNLDAANDPCVRISAAGYDLHRRSVDQMAPEVLPILDDIDRGDLVVTARTLTELRRTLENLPV